MNTPTDLVYIDDYGLRGSNFYWHKYATHGLTKEDILAAGLTSDRVQVSETLIKPLFAVNKELAERGQSLYVKEGYRSTAIYDIVYKRRVEKYGQEMTDVLLNMEEKPHALGRSVDVALWDVAKDEEIYLRRREDGAPALFVDFYKGKPDKESQNYQALQEDLIDRMQRHGFCVGKKREYFHFDYRPEAGSKHA
jgi:D-alanyl-D-alanine dipeptidase